MRLYDLINVRDEDNYEYRKNCEKLLIGIVSEYAIDYLQINAKDVKIYPKIQSYFLNGGITSDELIGYYRKNVEIGKVVSIFPSTAKKEFVPEEWDNFLKNCLWECDGIRNQYKIGNLLFKSRCLFLKQYQNKGGTYALIYKRIDEKYVFSAWGIESFQCANLTPIFYLKKKTEEEIKAEKEDILFDITLEQFFNSSETLQKLDDDQRKAVMEGTDKNLVILAGAGSGKTRTLLCRYAYLHVMKNIPIRKLLLITFTKEAKAKLEKDGTKLLKEIYGIYRPGEAPSMSVCTIDKLFKDLLYENSYRFGFQDKSPKLKVEQKREYEESLRYIIRENGLEESFRSYSKDKYLIQEMEGHLSGVPDNVINFEWLSELFIEHQRRRNCIYSFVYISILIRNAMREDNSWLKEEMLKRFDAILIDEFQDINRLQNDVFQCLYQDQMHFTFVGDDDQSIYEWRGADSEIIKAISKQANTKTISLLTNYRNNPNIVNAGNYILNMIEDRAKVGKKIVAKRESGSRIRVTEYDDKYENLVSEVKKLIQIGRLEKEICFLCRGNKQKEAIYNALKGAGIKVQKEKEKINVNDYRYRIFKAIVFILSDCNLSYACKEILRIYKCKDCTEGMVIRIVRGEADAPSNLRELQKTADNIRLCQSNSLAGLVEHFILYCEEIEDREEVEENVTLKLFEDFCRNMNAPWPIEQVRLRSELRAFEKGDGAEKEQNERKGVVVSTIHGSKGLEFEVVFIVGLNEGEYPCTKQIEREYNAKCRQLEQLKESSAKYEELKREITPDLFVKMKSQCKNEKFGENLNKELERLERRLERHRMDIMGLNAEGIEIYLEHYQDTLLSRIREYEEEKNKNLQEKLQYMSRKEYLSEQIQYLREIEAELEEMLVEQESEDSESEDLEYVKQKPIIRQQTKSLSELESELELVNQELYQAERKEIQHNRRVAYFTEVTSYLTLHYQRCQKAKVYLEDKKKEEDAVRVKERLERRKKKKINEERRGFYVALTRVIDVLYLCYSKKGKMSEFITSIPEKYREEYVTLSSEEIKELQRLHGDILYKINKNASDEAIDMTINALVSKDRLKKLTQKGYEQYLQRNPVFKKLPSNAKVYFERAMRILYLSDVVDISMDTEFAHNIQRMAEILLQETAGSLAQPWRIEKSQINGVAEKVRYILDACVTSSKPSYKYFYETIFNPMRSDQMKNLKSLAIEHYLIRSGQFKVDTGTKNTWKVKGFHGDAEEFCVAAVDLSNIRNDLVHGNSMRGGTWREDPISMILDRAKIVVEGCVM